MFDINELKAKKVDELQVIAKNLNIKKISQQKKMELIYSILDHQADNSAMQKNENPKAAADTDAKKPSPKRENKNPDEVKAGKAQNQQQRKPVKAEEKKSSPKETTAPEKMNRKREKI